MLQSKDLLSSPVWIHLGVTDMRSGMDRLSVKVREETSCDVLSGGLYVFLSRCRRRMKILYWDEDGYALWQKRLEAGVFRVERRSGYEAITGVDLKLLLSGMDLSRIQLRKSAENGLFS